MLYRHPNRYTARVFVSLFVQDSFLASVSPAVHVKVVRAVVGHIRAHEAQPWALKLGPHRRDERGERSMATVFRGASREVQRGNCRRRGWRSCRPVRFAQVKNEVAGQYRGYPMGFMAHSVREVQTKGMHDCVRVVGDGSDAPQ